MLTTDLKIRIEDTELELLHEGIHVELDFVLVELVLECLVAAACAGPFKERAVHLHIESDSTSANIKRVITAAAIFDK